MTSLKDKLTLANDNVPKTYEAGKSCKNLADFSYFFYNHKFIYSMFKHHII